MRSIVWFRKGLRTHDQPTLRACADKASSVVPVFVLDKWHGNPRNVGNVRFTFMMQSLRSLDEALKKSGVKCGLLFVRGEPASVLPKLWAALQAKVVGFDDEEEMEPHSRRDDERVKQLAKEDGIEVVCEHGHWLHSPERYAEVLGEAPVPLTMQHFDKLFRRAGAVPKPVPGPETLPFEDGEMESALSAARQALGVSSFALPQAADDEFFKSLGRERVEIKFPGGEREALDRLDKVVRQRPRWAANFEKPKTAPNSLQPDTTVLSPYLTSGCLSVRTAYWAVMDAYEKVGSHSKAPVSLEAQLLWREHWYSISRLSGQDVSRMSGNDICRQIPWDTSKSADDKLECWARGATGFPFIDAIMRQLRLEGWIHHLARHAVACFLTRGDLWVSWERGEKVFDELLIDADWSLNACNWMWLSCSAFFFQYFRCYSPIAFGKKTDPNGDYIRKYVPELAKMPAKYIYEPWTAPKDVQEKAGCRIGTEYPNRIVQDHTATSKENMAKIQEAYKPYQKGGELANIKRVAAAECCSPPRETKRSKPSK